MKNPFWLINTARGSAVKSKDLVDGIENGKILGAALDVLEYEKKTFENTFDNKIHQNFLDLIENEKIILSPHIAGWTHESELKLAEIIVQKIQEDFPVWNFSIKPVGAFYVFSVLEECFDLIFLYALVKFD